jgi:acetyl esterase/lipase
VWRQRVDRWHLSPFAAFLAGYGFAVASVEYRRGGGEPARAGRWPETLDDAATAADTAAELAMATLGAEVVDPRRTVLSGHSAGGHLALWAAARHVLPPESPWHRPSPPRVRGVVALAPIADFGSARQLRLFTDGVVEFLGGPEHADARQPHADPAALLPTGIAITIVQGANDIDLLPEVSAAFAEAAAKAGEEAQLTVLDGVGHFGLVDPDNDAAAVVAEEIAQLAW